MTPTRCGGASWSEERKQAFRAKRNKAEEQLKELLRYKPQSEGKEGKSDVSICKND